MESIGSKVGHSLGPLSLFFPFLLGQENEGGVWGGTGVEQGRRAAG